MHQPGQPNGGVVLLKSGRVLGGDSGYMYEGAFKELPNNTMEAEIRVKGHTPGWTSAFGIRSDNFSVRMEGKLSDTGVTGFMYQPNNPATKLPVSLTRAAEAP